MLKKMIRTIVVATACAVMGFAATAQESTVKIGTLNPLTGPLGTSGAYAFRGHEMAVAEINAAGGIKNLDGAMLELVNGDSQGNPSTGRAETTRLIDEGAAIVIGAFQSSVTLDASLVTERAGIPFLDPTAVADSLTTRGLKTFLMMTVKTSTGYADQIAFVAELAESLGIENPKLALLYESSDFGQWVASSQMAAIAKHSNMEIIADISYEANSGDLSSQMARIRSTKPDFLLDTSYIVDAINIARAMARLGMDDVVQVSSGGGIFEEKYTETLGDIANGKFTLNYWSHDVNDAAAAFAVKYSEKYGDSPNGNAAQCYLATYMVAAALEKSGSADPEALLDSLRNLKTEDLPEQALVMQYGVEFNPETGYNDAAFAMATQIQDGKHVLIWPKSIAKSEAVLP